MGAAPVEKELPWDNVTQAVALAVVKHRPDATATEAYYHLAMQHIAQLLWRFGVGDLALHALNVVLRDSVNESRARIHDASAETRTRS